MTDENGGAGTSPENQGDLIEIDLNFESMRRFQAEFSPNLSREGIFIDTGEPLEPGSVVRFRVILPEDFIFLEGTAVVEWRRGLDGVVDGVPGMALRFATLSPQNQELVEQLVEDHVDAGGTPFNLDVRPSLGDFPTDALEGASSQVDAAGSDGYRLTIRNAGSDVDEDVIAATASAVSSESDRSDETPESPEDEAPGAGEQPSFGFEIVSEAPEPPGAVASAEDEVPDREEPEPVLAVGDPPDLDWSEGEEDAPVVEPPPAGQEPETEPASDPVGLGVPEDFEAGPEIMDAGPEAGVAGEAFDVSLAPGAEDDEEPTPVLPDDGRDDVMVPGDYGDGEPSGSRRLWPYFLAAAFVLAVAGGFLRPHVAEWLESRGSDDAAPALEAVVVEPAVETEAPSGEAPDEAAATPVEEVEAEGGGGASDGVEIVDVGIADVAEPLPGEQPEAEQERVVELLEDSGGEPAAPAQAEQVELAPAATVESITVAPATAGTVVRIRADGSFAEGAVTVEALSSPPRALLRLRGITSDFKPYAIEAGTSEVEQLRIGLHPERRPPELWVVVDLAGPAISVGEVEVVGSSVELVLGQR
ncbi:MAG: PilZ domain-containing protein [Thermoanaerobaculales bacterium]|jgi:uncharacterized protein (TIGR02266 family)|nr:PilZ domain-containing protein [Thermoanaerobaculales bacterium]